MLWTALFIASLVLQYASFAAPRGVLAADTAFRAPGAAAAPNEWDDPDGALADGGTMANADADNEDQGYVNFGFSLPVGSIVDGITVQAEAITSDPGCQLQARVSAEQRLELQQLPVGQPDQRAAGRHAWRQHHELGPDLGSDGARERRVQARDPGQRPR